MKRKYDKLKEKLEVIKAAECSLSAPPKEKLAVLERLYGQYSLHVLCEALDVSRGTFYNHVFRRKKTAWYEIRREELREQVKIVFDESKQRFGLRRIRAILIERGIKVSTSKAFRRLLYLNKVVQSFSRSGRPHDNAVAETFFSALKKEELYRINFKAEREFYESVDNYIVFFNTKRPHTTLAYKTPEQFEKIYYKKQKNVSK